MSTDKRCLFCQENLPAAMREDARYCSARCRVRDCRKRQSRATPVESSEPSPNPNPSQDSPGSAAEPAPEKRPRPTMAELRELLQRAKDEQARTRQLCAETQQQSEQRLAARHEEFETRITATLAQFVSGLFQQAPEGEFKTRLAAEAAPHLANFIQQFPAAKLEAKLPPIVAEDVARMIQDPPRAEVPRILPTNSRIAAPPSAARSQAPDRRLNYEESYKGEPEKPVNSEEAAQRQRLQRALEEGYNPVVDVLVFAKLEEIEAFDRLARWQTEQGLPLTVKPIPPDQDREYLAAIGALQERWHYQKTPPPQRRSFVAWLHPGWRLDPKSETDLLRQVYKRIESKLRIPSKKPWFGFR